MQKFYCSETMEYRTGDKYCSPIEDIYDICHQPEGCYAFLLLGHKGCGKSTELNRLSERLLSDGYPVKTVTCSMDLDMFHILYSDLFILMGEALLQIAQELGCELKESMLHDITNFWFEGMETVVTGQLKAVSAETSIAAESPGILKNVLKLFAKLKSDLKFSEETRKEYRKKISTHSSEWMLLLNQMKNEILWKTNGKHPIIIFEDLDKLNPNEAWNIFYNYAAILSSLPFPVIYTFPIGLSYDVRFSAIESYFITKTLPMIKIETKDGQPFWDGMCVISKIVEMRASLELFEPDVLNTLIQGTGGSLRDLFMAIRSAAIRTVRRESATICMADAHRALEELKTSLTRRIEKKDYPFLLHICHGNKEQIEDKETLLKMLQASVVLEYNGLRWHNVHPLVAKFLQEQGLTTDAEL